MDAVVGDSLNGYVERPRLRGINIDDPAKLPMLFDKSWEERHDRSKYVESDVDEDMLVWVPLTEVVKIRAICIVGGGEGAQPDDAPSKVKIFVNREDLDLDSAKDLPCDQELDLQRGQYADMEHPLKQSKFSNVRNLTFYVHKNFGGENTRLNCIHLRGTSTKASSQKVILNTVYETQGQLKDHKTRGVETGKEGF